MKLILTLFLNVLPIVVLSQFIKLHNFNVVNGEFPHGKLISDGTFLYGITSSGGLNDYGVIYKIKPDGSQFSKIYDFNEVDGKRPYASLYYDGLYLYGKTSDGGINGGYGTIYKIKPDGTGFTKLFDFDDINYNNMNNFSDGALVSDGTFLYGTTNYGGIGAGCIFKIKSDGTAFEKLFDFNGPDGSIPIGSLYFNGSKLFGMTQEGGSTGRGVAYSINTDGTGYKKLIDFELSNGKLPRGSLISDGTYLFGMTSQGGANNLGLIFKIKEDGTEFTVLKDFSNSSGSHPQGSLQLNGEFLYGTFRYGGFGSTGGIFKIKLDGSNYEIIYHFGINNTIAPDDIYSDGSFLYGATTGLSNSEKVGLVFKFIENTSGIDNFISSDNVKIYPNPSNDLITIALNSKLVGSKYSVYNSLGQTLMKGIIDSEFTQINLMNFSSGSYFINFGENNKQYLLMKN